MRSAEGMVVAALLRLMRSRTGSNDFQQAQVVPPSGEKRPPVRRREARFADFEAVAKLQEQWGLAKNSVENWYRLWRDNPALELSNAQLSMGWVLESEDAIVGYHGSIPLHYHYGDRQLLATAATSLVVEPAYRASAVALVAPLYRQRNIDLFLITTAVEVVGKMAMALRVKPLPQADYDTVLFWVLNARELASAVATRFGADGPMGRLAAVLASLAVRTGRRGPPRIRHNIQVTEIQVQEIGDEFEALWRRKVAERPRLMADRSPAFLRWHFTVPKSRRQTTVLCCRMQGRLAGYAVVQNDVDDIGLYRCRLVDLLVEGDDPEVAENLLAAAYAHARASRSHVFEVLGFPRSVRQILLPWRPYLRKYPACPFFYKAADQSLKALLADERNWYATPFDGDTTLMP